jgi:hypothetical protein
MAGDGDARGWDGQQPPSEPGWGQPQPQSPPWAQQPPASGEQSPARPGWGQQAPQQPPAQPGWGQAPQQPPAQPGWGQQAPQQPPAQPGWGQQGAPQQQAWGAQPAGAQTGWGQAGGPGGPTDYPGGQGWDGLQGGGGLPAAPPPKRRSIGLLIRLGIAVVVIGGGIIGWITSADRDSDGNIVSAGNLVVTDLAVGDCFDDEAGADATEGQLVSSIRAVPCAEPHDNEVFHVFTATGGDELPNRSALDDQIGAQCLPAFDDFVGVAYEESELDFFTFEPTADGWRRGDRRVICALYELDFDKLEGTARGVRR